MPLYEILKYLFRLFRKYIFKFLMIFSACIYTIVTTWTIGKYLDFIHDFFSFKKLFYLFVNNFSFVLFIVNY